MVIDFHTHIFPDALAARAIGGLEQSGNVKSVLSGQVYLIRHITLVF